MSVSNPVPKGVCEFRARSRGWSRPVELHQSSSLLLRHRIWKAFLLVLSSFARCMTSSSVWPGLSQEPRGWVSVRAYVVCVCLFFPSMIKPIPEESSTIELLRASWLSWLRSRGKDHEIMSFQMMKQERLLWLEG